MGTITSIEENSKFIVITDADGKNRKIHINPLTHICLINKEKKIYKNNNEENINAEKKHFTNLTFNDLKIGNWITVKKFNTDTETPEALFIKVFF